MPTGRDGSGVFDSEDTPWSLELSTSNANTIRNRLSEERLRSYEQATAGDVPSALELYRWNGEASAALFELVGLAEVTVRNAMAEQVEAIRAKRGWPTPWYRVGQRVFGPDDIRDIQKAIDRATARGRHAEVQGKVIAELNFGFWRFLTSRRHHTTLWVPGLYLAFPNLAPGGPSASERERVFRRMEDINLLRNRIAHHEPIHRRDLAQDEGRILEFIEWICRDVAVWAGQCSRVSTVISQRPR